MLWVGKRFDTRDEREGSLAHQGCGYDEAINEDGTNQVNTRELVPNPTKNQSTQETDTSGGGGKRKRSVEQENSSDLNETGMSS